MCMKPVANCIITANRIPPSEDWGNILSSRASMKPKGRERTWAQDKNFGTEVEKWRWKYRFLAICQ